MAIENQTIEEGLVAMGQNGKLLQWGTFNWTSTDVTGELKLNMRAALVFLSPIGTPDADEVYSVNESINGAGFMVVPASTGTVTVTRTGSSPVSAQKMGYLAIGF